MLALLLACSTFAFPLNPSLDINQYAHTAWKVRDGFAKGLISSIAQTPDGYLWLGTQFGLLRFDGVKNVVWPENERLPSSYIMSLYAARDGTLWIGTAKGLASWKDGVFRRYDETQDHFIYAIVADSQGTVWASAIAVAQGKLCAIHNSNVQCYGEGVLGRGAFNLYVDSKGNLWAGVFANATLWRLPRHSSGLQVSRRPKVMDSLRRSRSFTAFAPAVEKI